MKNTKFDFSVAYAHLIQACLQTIEEHNLEQLVYDCPPEEVPSIKADIYSVLFNLINPIDENDEDMVVVPKVSNELKDTFFTTKTQDGKIHLYTKFENDFDFFITISKTICFSNLSGEDVKEIYYKGEKIHYAGWQSDLYFQFLNENGETVWDYNLSSVCDY